MPSSHLVCTLSRRAASAALIAAPYLWLGSRAQAQAVRQLTPSQTEGPFYPVKLPKDSDYDLLRNGAQSYTAGQAAWVQGNVTDIEGKPVADLQVAFEPVGSATNPNRDRGQLESRMPRASSR